MKRTMSPLVVLLIIIGLFRPTCENLNNVSDSAVSNHTASSNQRIINRAQLNNSALEYWPVANRTDVKTFRRGSLVISRRYWYPVLEIAIKKPNPTSPAITLATTPILSYTTQSFNSVSLPATASMLPTSSFPATAQTTTLGPSTTKTTKSTISIEPLTSIIQAHTSKQMTTSRQISETTESQTSTLPTTINSSQPTTITSSTISVLPKTATSDNIPLNTSRQLTATTSTLSVFPETITPSATPATTSIQPTNNINTRNTVGTTLKWTPEETATSLGTTNSMHTTTVMNGSNAPKVTGTAISSANLPATSGGVSFESLKTTIEVGTTAERTSRTAALASPTTLWSKVAPGTTRAAATTLTGLTTLTTPKTEVMTTLQPTQTVPITEAVTIYTEQSAIKSTTWSAITEASSPQVTMEPLSAKTYSITPSETTVSASETAPPATKIPTSSAIFTAAEATSKTTSTSTGAISATALGTTTAATVRNEPDITKTTLAQGSSTGLNSMAVDTVTTTTGLAGSATAPKASTLAPETSQVTVEPLPAQTENTTLMSKPVTVSHTSEVSTSVKRVTEELTTQADVGSSSAGQTTLKASGTTESTIVPTTAARSAETTNTDPPNLNEGSISLRFSLNETFQEIYKNSSSSAFIILATKVVTVINLIYKASYLNGYKRCRVESFTKGSIKVDMTLIFENSNTVPSKLEVESILNGTAKNETIPLNIILETIKAGEIVTSNTPAPNTPVTIQTTTKKSTASTNENTNTTSGAFSQMVCCSIMSMSPVITILLAQTVMFL